MRILSSYYLTLFLTGLIGLGIWMSDKIEQRNGLFLELTKNILYDDGYSESIDRSSYKLKRYVHNRKRIEYEREEYGDVSDHLIQRIDTALLQKLFLLCKRENQIVDSLIRLHDNYQSEHYLKFFAQEKVCFGKDANELLWKNFNEFDSLFTVLSNEPLYQRFEHTFHGEEVDTVMMVDILGICKRIDTLRYWLPEKDFVTSITDKKKIQDLDVLEFLLVYQRVSREMSIILEEFFSKSEEVIIGDESFRLKLRERHLKSLGLNE